MRRVTGEFLFICKQEASRYFLLVDSSKQYPPRKRVPYIERLSLIDLDSTCIARGCPFYSDTLKHDFCPTSYNVHLPYVLRLPSLCIEIEDDFYHVLCTLNLSNRAQKFSPTRLRNRKCFFSNFTLRFLISHFYFI